MKIVNIGTYPPKQCGIATFSMDLRNSLIANDNTVKCIALSDDKFIYSYSEEVILNLKQNKKSAYMQTAKLINNSPDIDLVVLQHEYGIFGGKDGNYILELTKHLEKPYVLICHTVLPRPGKKQKLILYHLCQRASGIVAMSNRSAKLLIDLYQAPQDIINVIPHGVPEFVKEDADKLKTEYGLQGRDIISTFGLIGSGKGLEIGIEAMVSVAQEYPSALFLILGETHPMLKKVEGEKYRNMLVAMVEELNLQNNVQFVNKYLSIEELGKYLHMTDIYLSPYPNKDQAVSGTMAFAIGCGKAIVSTPYAYARENLAQGRGLLTKKADPNELANSIKKILADPQLKQTLQENAYALGKNWLWPNIGRQYTDIFKKIMRTELNREEQKYNYAEL